MSNINLEAYGKLSTAFGYAQQIKDAPGARGRDTVVHLQDGNRLTCNYSRTDAPRGLFRPSSRNQDQKNLNNATRAIFKQAVIDIFGRSINDVPKSVRTAMELGKFDNTGKPLTARRILAVNKAIDAELKSLAKQFGFTGAAAPAIIAIVAKGSGLAEAANPAALFKTRVDRHAKATVTTLIATQMAKNASYTSFSLDIARGMDVSLGGKKLKTRNPAEARDKIVQFVTGDKRATFDKADEATKCKANVLMSMMHQGSFACAMGAVGNGFDPEDKLTKFNGTEGTAMGGEQTNGFALTKDAAGNITIKGTAKFFRHTSLLANNGQDAMQKATDNDGSYMKYEIEIKLSRQDMDKFAKADWSKCKTGEAERIEQDANLVDRFQKAADTVDGDYKFTGSATATFKGHIKALHELSEIYERNNH